MIENSFPEERINLTIILEESPQGLRQEIKKNKNRYQLLRFQLDNTARGKNRIRLLKQKVFLFTQIIIRQRLLRKKILTEVDYFHLEDITCKKFQGLLNQKFIQQIFFNNWMTVKAEEIQKVTD
jgi:hypothetical protein